MIRRVRAVLAAVAFVFIVGVSTLLGVALAPGLPWWAYVFGVAFWLLLIRRRRLAAAGLLEAPDPAGPAWSPTRSGGGL